MSWVQILGFFTMWLHPEITVGLWSKAGVPLWYTLLFTTIWTSITLSLTYLGVGWLKTRAQKVKFIMELIQKAEELYQNNRFGPKNREHQKKAINWLVRQKNWIILGCGFIPFVYGLPAAVIIAAKLIGIRYALLVLLFGNFFRNAIICSLIYQGFKILS